MWILSRKPYLDERLKAVIYQFLLQTGVGLKGLKVVEQTHCPHREVKIPEETLQEEYAEYQPELEPNHSDNHPPTRFQEHFQQQQQQQPQQSGYQGGSEYPEGSIQPNYQAPVQVGQSYKPGQIAISRPEIPHYHDDNRQKDAAYQTPDDQGDDHSDKDTVLFQDNYSGPRGQRDGGKDNEGLRTYRDRKGPATTNAYREEDDVGSETRRGKEYVRSPDTPFKLNVTTLIATNKSRGNDDSKKDRMEYYEYKNGGETLEDVRNESRRLRRPSLEDDVRLDKERVTFLEFNNKDNNGSALLFIRGKKERGDSDTKSNPVKFVDDKNR